MHKGLLKTWKTDKGFGFIKSDTLEHDTFIHISALKHMSRKPKVGDTIYFEVATQPDGKTKAINCRIEGVAELKAPYQKHTQQPYRIAKSKKLLAVDVIYKLSAPCTLLFIIFSYLYSVKPVFDKHEELQNKSSQLENLTVQVANLKNEVKLNQTNLEISNKELDATSKKLNSNNNDLNKLSKQYDEVSKSLNQKSNKLKSVELKANELTEKLTEKNEQLAVLNNVIDEKSENLKKITLSLNSSESAAITFYINTVVSEISNEGMRHSVSNLYSDNKNKYNLRKELMDIVKSKKTNDYEKYSQKYYEQLAIKEIEEFSQTKVKENESDYSKVFGLLTYVSNKKYLKKVKLIYENMGQPLPDKYKQ